MALARDTHIPIWYLIQCFVLDRTLPSGLRWRERPLAHFPDKRMWKSWNTKWAGKPAGSLGNQGYWIVILKAYRASPIKAHRIIYALINGHWPPDEVDHKNRKRAANKIENLRAVTRSQNM